MLKQCDDRGFEAEIQVVVCENPELDAAIEDQGVADAGPVGGFTDGLRYDSLPSGTRIWAPVIGEGAGAALEAVFTFLEPDEVCPVLPFPG